jgi:hypothetical protein
VLTVAALTPPAAGLSGEGEAERLPVEAGPVGDDIGDEATVVSVGEDHVVGGGAADVEAMHPGVPGEDGVDEVAEPPPLSVERRVLFHANGPAQERRGAAACPHGARCYLGEAVDELGRCEAGPLADLGRGHGIDHGTAAAVAGGAEVVGELADGGLSLGHADYVRHHRPHVPQLADRRAVPLVEFATGAFLGTELLLRPDIYQQGQPPCPQQPGGQYLYNPRNDLWFCNRLGVDPSA